MRPGEGLLDRLNPVSQAFHYIIPLAKIAAGGTIMLVSAVALVYVAGRKTPTGKAALGAATTAASAVIPGGPAVKTALGVRKGAATARKVPARKPATKAKTAPAHKKVYRTTDPGDRAEVRRLLAENNR